MNPPSVATILLLHYLHSCHLSRIFIKTSYIYLKE